MSKRAVIYGRVSQDMQRDNYSIPTQVALCLRHAKEHSYSVVGKQHVDRETGRDTIPGPDTVLAFIDNHSGTELLRPSVTAMLTFLRTEGADAVIVLSLDRLARDPYIRQTLEHDIEASGARVIYVQGNYAETPEGEIHKDLDGAFAKWENMKRVERSVRGKIGKAQRGIFAVGPAPYGYKLDKTAFGGLAVCEEEAQVIKQIFDQYTAQDRSIRDIVRFLTAADVTPVRCDAWVHTTVHRILRNEIYIGRAYYNRRRSIVVGDGITTPKRRRSIDREPGEAILIPVTPLIDQVAFDQAQRRLDHNREVKRRQATHFYLLQGMVVCGNCNKRYTVHTKNAHGDSEQEARLYRHRKDDGACRNHRIKAEFLETPVWAGVSRVLLDPVQLAEGYEATQTAQREKQAQAKDHLETLRRNLTRLENRQAGLVRIYADGDITRAEFLAQRTPLDRERMELTAKANELEASLADMPTAEDLAGLRTFIDSIRDAIEGDQLTQELKRELLQDLNVEVIMGTDGMVTVTGIFQPFEIRLLSRTCSYS